MARVSGMVVNLLPHLLWTSRARTWPSSSVRRG